MIQVKSNVKAYMHALRIIGKKNLPGAVAATFNKGAAAIEHKARLNAKKDLIIRTPYTTNSIKQDRFAKGNDIGKMFSRVGSNSPYLYKHDEGGTVEAAKSKLPIPLLVSRGGDLKKRVLRRLSLDKIGEMPNPTFFMGVPKGKGRKPGIYERHGEKLKRIRSLSVSSVRIPATHFYTRAANQFGTVQFVNSTFITEANRRLTEAYAITNRGIYG